MLSSKFVVIGHVQILKATSSCKVIEHIRHHRMAWSEKNAIGFCFVMLSKKIVVLLLFLGFCLPPVCGKKCAVNSSKEMSQLLLLFWENKQGKRPITCLSVLLFTSIFGMFIANNFQLSWCNLSKQLHCPFCYQYMLIS